jgi:hypothetical protein
MAPLKMGEKTVAVLVYENPADAELSVAANAELYRCRLGPLRWRWRWIKNK